MEASRRQTFSARNWSDGGKTVQHLYKLGRALNEREVDFPSFINDFFPGANDMEDDWKQNYTQT